MYRYVYPSVYQSVWPHLRFKKCMSRIHHNYSRRIDSRPHGFDARKFNRGSQGKRHRYTYEDMATALHKREMFIADGLTRADFEIRRPRFRAVSRKQRPAVTGLNRREFSIFTADFFIVI